MALFDLFKLFELFDLFESVGQSLAEARTESIIEPASIDLADIDLLESFKYLELYMPCLSYLELESDNFELFLFIFIWLI